MRKPQEPKSSKAVAFLAAVELGAAASYGGYVARLCKLTV
jgi:hypothetical protein